MFTIMEKIDGHWVMVVEEGLCNPYQNPENAWIDCEYLRQHSNGTEYKIEES